jgi:hypothetical protein
LAAASDAAVRAAASRAARSAPVTPLMNAPTVTNAAIGTRSAGRDGASAPTGGMTQ